MYLPGHVPMHPGAKLRDDVLPALGLTQLEAAERLSISAYAMKAFLLERTSLNVELAIKLDRLTGVRVDLWLSMQAAYDLRWQKPESVTTRRRQGLVNRDLVTLAQRSLYDSWRGSYQSASTYLRCAPVLHTLPKTADDISHTAPRPPDSLECASTHNAPPACYQDESIRPAKSV